MSDTTQQNIAETRERLDQAISGIKEKYDEEIRPFLDQLKHLQSTCLHPNAKYHHSFSSNSFDRCPDCGHIKMYT